MRALLGHAHRLAWSVRIGRCGGVARAAARALRRVAPVRGIAPLTNIVLGAPPARSAPVPARARIGGVEFALDLRESLHRAVYLDLFSLELRRVVLPLLGRGELFVDAGANFGFWALLAARRGCRVIAIEPLPATRTRLQENARRNGLDGAIEVVAAALSDEGGALTLSVTGGESGQASAHPPQGSADAETFVVPAVTLDSLLGERAVRFLKIDVEGHEPALLRGADRVLRAGRVDFLLIELSGGVLGRSGGSAAELIDWLAERGYRFVRFIRANEGLAPRRSYRRVTLEELRRGGHAGDALWVHESTTRLA
ncbi:MAG TPA: FkbM family methyltransferase [Solirubrobacteraceae bacterium]|nr:FkbM family methyltransferase [Solirubrobacteraceae bacterium]